MVIQTIHFTHKNVVIEDIDNTFKLTNKSISLYCKQVGLPLTFDFRDKNNRAIYKNYFILHICEFIKQYSCNRRTIFYNNLTSKDPFRQKLVEKIRRIFGIKVFHGTWDYSTFCDLLKTSDTFLTEQMDILINCDCKPKNFKHIKKYLEKEGLYHLNDIYFQELANMMTIVC